MTRTVDIVVGAADADAAELEDEVLGLRRELLELDVDEVRRPAAEGGDVPAGAKGVEMLAVSTLVVTLGQESVKALVATAVDWLRRRRGGGGQERGGVRIELDGDVLELRDGTSPEDRALVDAFLARHEAPA